MIGVIGVSHKRSDLSVREAVARVFLSWEQDRCVPLFTCNRAEWYFSTLTPETARQEMADAIRTQVGESASRLLYSFFGLECFRHLGCVVAGLDSLFVGETEIQGQVKAAYEEARKKGVLPSELHFLFQRSLRTGKILRHGLQLPVEEGLCGQVANLMTDYMRTVDEPAALLIGTSMVNRRLARMLHERKVPVAYVNRTFERAQEASNEVLGRAIPWADLSAAWMRFPCVVAATRSSEYVLRACEESPSCRQLLIDLGVPRNIDPSLASEERHVINIDGFAPVATAKASLASRAQNDFAVCACRWGS